MRRLQLGQDTLWNGGHAHVESLTRRRGSLVRCDAGLLRAQAATDPLRELLSEVRALRLTLERTATTSAKVQVLIARSQVNESRIAALERRIEAVRASMASTDAEVSTVSNELNVLEARLQSPTPEGRERIESAVNTFRIRAQLLSTRRQEQTTRESELMQQINQELGRLVGVNEQLDELERSLTSKRENR